MQKINDIEGKNKKLISILHMVFFFLEIKILEHYIEYIHIVNHCKLMKTVTIISKLYHSHQDEAISFMQ